MTSEAYDAMTERKLRERFPQAEQIIVTRNAPTRAGFRIVSRHPKADTRDVVYYRKASGGKWGKSVQLLAVRPAAGY